MNVKFMCNLCFFEFSSNNNLIKHKQRVHNKTFKCGKCDAAFGESYLLIEHIKVKHEGYRFHCSYSGCSQTFLSKSSTTAHFRQVHSLEGQKRFDYQQVSDLLKQINSR